MDDRYLEVLDTQRAQDMKAAVQLLVDTGFIGERDADMMLTGVMLGLGAMDGAFDGFPGSGDYAGLLVALLKADEEQVL